MGKKRRRAWTSDVGEKEFDLRGNKQDFEAEINASLQQHPGIKVVDNKQSASVLKTWRHFFLGCVL
jgi:hypothetical protein